MSQSIAHRLRPCAAALILLLACFLAEPALAASAEAASRLVSLPLPGPLPPIRLLTLLVGVHLIGLCFGLGGATMLDFWILRWMRWGGLPPEVARTFMFVSKVVSIGIGLLWLSGLGFLAIYAVESPEKLANPKLYAKIVVVLALTLNGLLIHALVLPTVVRDVSRPMFEGVSHVSTIVFLVSGAVSGVSWYTAFALGLMRELNGRVASGLLLTLWVAGMIAAAIAAYLYWQHLMRRSARGEMAAPAPDLRPLDFDREIVPPHPLRAIPLTFISVPANRTALFGARRWPSPS